MIKINKVLARLQKGKENVRKKRIEAAQLEDKYSDSIVVRFDNLGGGFDVTIRPFDTVFEDRTHTLAINCFSSGSVEFSRKITKEELEKYEEAKRLRSENKLSDSDAKKYPYWQIKQEGKKFMSNEIWKAAKEFDAKIAAIAKKYGYIRK